MKKHKKDNLDNKLFEIFDNKEQLVPSFVWTNLENELFPKKKKRFFLWLFLSCSFIFNVCLFFLINTKNEMNFNQKPKLAKIESIKGVAINHIKPKIYKELNGKPKLSKTTKKVLNQSKEMHHTPYLLSHKTTPSNTFFDFNNLNNFNNDYLHSSNIKTNVNRNSSFNDPILEGLSLNRLFNRRDNKLSNNLKSYNFIENNIIKDTIIKNQVYIKPNKPATILNEFYILGGYSLFDISQNKSYIRGGALSPFTSNSNGFIFGFGTNLKLKGKHNFQFGFLFNKKIMTLPIDIYLDAVNYKNVVNNNKKVEFNNILNPNCNELFYVSNSNINYKISNLSLQALYSYNLYSKKNLNFSLITGTNIHVLQSAKINVPSFILMHKSNNNYLTELDFQFGIDFGYDISKKIRLSFQPYFQNQFFKIGESDLHLNKELVLPVKLSYLLKNSIK